MTKIHNGGYKWWYIHPTVWRAMRALHEGREDLLTIAERAKKGARDEKI